GSLHDALLSATYPMTSLSGEGGQMAVMIQMQVASAVTEIDEDACVGSSRENGTTMIMFALRQHDFHQELGRQATLWRPTDASHVDVHELSKFHHPILSRCIVAQGSYLDGSKPR